MPSFGVCGLCEAKKAVLIFGVLVVGTLCFLEDPMGFLHPSISKPYIQSVFQPYPGEEFVAALTKTKLLRSNDETASILPTVLVPGMGDSCFNPGFSQLTNLVAGRTAKEAFCVGAGGDPMTDAVYSFTKTMDEQVEHFANKVKTNPSLAIGFNAIGLSQGNLIVRAYSKNISLCMTIRLHH
jgi:hypothetical protein